MFHICKPESRRILEKELALHHLSVDQKGEGWILSKGPAQQLDFCFAQVTLEDPLMIRSEKTNKFIAKLADTFFEAFREVQVDESWPLVLQSAVIGMSSRMKTVEEDFLKAITKKMSRVAKLAQVNPSGLLDEQAGFFVYLVDHTVAYAATHAWFGGQRRMKDDPKAPSRSYLKVEEAYGILGCEPQEGETVIDLGAAPGGWSYSAAKRGAKVMAVDNGPLKGVASNHPLITHFKEDAFKFFPPKKHPVDWLFCDMVFSPFVIMDLMKKWINHRWCHHFIFNLKFDRQDPLVLIQKLQESRLVERCSMIKVCQLYHDREEITVMGNVMK